MKEDLSGPYPGYGFGALDAFDGYISYRLLDEEALAEEIAEMRLIIDKTADDLVITQDLGLGMMLWMTHFFPRNGGPSCSGAALLPCLIECGSKTATSAASLTCQRCASPLRIMAFRLVCRPQARCPTSNGLMPISRATAQATNMIEPPSAT